jgi:hypothetical protein
MRLVKMDFEEGKTVRYPKIYFHDIYTPLHHSTWVNHAGPKPWFEEPDKWIDRFSEVFFPYALHQCISSADRRLEREQPVSAFGTRNFFRGGRGGKGPSRSLGRRKGQPPKPKTTSTKKSDNLD